jgi:hypothetical protein
MVDRVPVKAVITSGSATGLAEYATGDTVPVANGGTGTNTVAGIKTALGIAAVTDAAVAAKFDKTGGNLTGGVTILPASGSAVLNLRKAASASEAGIYGFTGASVRWGLALGDASAESGNNAGSIFSLYRYSDTGAFLGAVLQARRTDATVTAIGPLETGATMYAVSGFSAPGIQANGWLARTTSYYVEGNYRTVLGMTLESIGDTANIRAWHNPGVESFVRISVGGTGHYAQFGNNGYAGFTGGYGGTSDQRVKYDNQRIENALDKVDQLHGYTFIRQDMADKQGRMPRRAGLIAQDVLKVLPEAVMVPANYDAEKWRGDLLSLEAAGVLGLLVEAIKEQRAEVKALRAEVALLRLGSDATAPVDATVKGATGLLKP